MAWHPCQFFKSFKNHTQLSRIHLNHRSVTRIRSRLVRLYVRFTRMANRISRVFCVRQALMKVKSIAECSPWSILQYFDLHLVKIGLENQFLVFYLSGHLRHVLLLTFQQNTSRNNLVLHDGETSRYKPIVITK